MKKNKFILIIILITMILFPQAIYAKERTITLCEEDRIPYNISVRDFFFSDNK